MEPTAFRSLLYRALAVPVGILVLLCVVLLWQKNSLVRTLALVDKSDQVTYQARRVLRITSDMDAGLCEYLLTDSKELLKPYVDSGAELEPNLRLLAEMVSDNPAQTARANKISEHALEWRAWATGMIKAREDGGNYASYERNAEGQRIMTALRAEREQLIAAEQDLRQQRANDAARISRLLDWSTVLLALLACVVIVVLTRRQFESLASSFHAALQAEENHSRSLAESRNSLYRQARLLDLAQEPIIVRDVEDRIVYWNQGAERVYGWSRDEATGRKCQELLKTEFPYTVEDIRNELHMTKRWEGELVQRTRGGEKRIFDSRWALQETESGGIAAILETNFDITDRKKDEDHLRMLSAIVESSYDAIIGKKIDGTIMSWNSGATSLYGYAPEEVIGRSIQITIPRDHPDEENALMSRIVRGEVIDQYETVRQRKDGSLVEVSLRISPIFDDSDKIVGASNIARDITGRKKNERALLQTEKLASVGRMAATVAHEINNPLAAAMNAVYLARTDQQLSERSRTALCLAEQELARVAHLTKQTLGFYREGGKPTAVRLAEVLDNVLNLYAPRIKNRCINVKCEYGHAIEVSVIEGEIRQVISNLIANSIDATDARGTGRITIRLAGPMVLDGDRPMVRLTIADHGEGISPENQARLFEPFFTTKQAVGTGLGLWVTKELVQKQQGKIKIRSRLGMGTVVTVWLPTERRGQPYMRIA